MPSHPEHGKRTGYERTPPTGGGGVGLTVSIQMTNLQKGFKETGQALTSFQKQLNKGLTQNGYFSSSSKSSFGRANITEVKFNALSSAIENDAHNWAKAIAAGGKSYFQEIIKSAPNRVKPRPGRIETHEMLRSVRGITHKYKGESLVEIGWISNYYRYFSFQEDGTSNGPTAMHAIPKTANYIQKEFKNSFGRMLKYRIENIK